MDMRIEIGAKLLDVKSEVLSEFEVEDTFNPGNRIAGVICRQSDHRYGALVITSVNGCDVTPQVIYCTPKLHYPFGSSDEGDRTYHWPKDIKRVEVYPKLDGCFAYHTPILLSDGTTIPIGHIVNQDLHPDIWSYNEDTKEVQISRITAGHKYQATKTKVKISFKKVGWQKGPSTLICTSDHKIFTPKGVVDAADLKPGSKA